MRLSDKQTTALTNASRTEPRQRHQLVPKTRSQSAHTVINSLVKKGFLKSGTETGSYKSNYGFTLTDNYDTYLLTETGEQALAGNKAKSKLGKRELKSLALQYIEYIVASHADANIVEQFFDGTLPAPLESKQVEQIEENMREYAARLRKSITYTVEMA